MNAPIVVFVYNRADHAKGVIESLAKCPEAKESKLYIFSDGPKNEKAIDKVESVRKYINSDEVKSYFGEVEVVEAPKNKGLANSVITGVDHVIKEHGSVIVVEDDNVVADDFLDYMNRGLDFYKDNQKVWALGGYTLPISFPKDYNHDVFMMGRGSSYAWATWVDRWEKIDWEIKDYEEFKKNRTLKKAFNKPGNDRTDMLSLQMEGKIDSWAIRFTYNAFRNNMYFILPVNTLTTNNGNDGSGIHVSKADHRFDTVILEERPKVKFEEVELDVRIQAEIAKLFNISFTKRIKKFVKKQLRKRG